MPEIIDTGSLSSRKFLGRLLRYPLRFIPSSTAIPILSGRLRGMWWIPGSAIHRCWMGFYELQKQQLISKEVQGGTVFYDVGANVGFYSLLASILVGPGEVFAFEPVPKNVAYLKKHLELNRVKNVKVFEVAVSDNAGTMRFQTEPTGFKGHLSSEGIPVSVTTLDTLVVDKEILPPKYIKMDIEGAELLALRGAETTIREFHPTIFLATHGHNVGRLCRELLESWGYMCQDLGPDRSDGFGEILARFSHQV